MPGTMWDTEVRFAVPWPLLVGPGLSNATPHPSKKSFRSKFWARKCQLRPNLFPEPPCGCNTPSALDQQGGFSMPETMWDTEVRFALPWHLLVGPGLRNATPHPLQKKLSLKVLGSKMSAYTKSFPRTTLWMSHTLWFGSTRRLCHARHNVGHRGSICSPLASAGWAWP